MSEWDVIYSYSRAQALADGSLVDVSTLAKEAGIKWPTAVTEAVWILLSTFPEKSGQSVMGRLWDTLCMFAVTAKKSNRQEVHFKVAYEQEGGLQEVELWGWCGPGDTEAPVITIMIEDED